VSNWKTLAFALVLSMAGLGLAAAARHMLVEPADMTAYCDGGASSGWCIARTWIIQAFVHQRIGWAALALAVLASVSGWRSAAALALWLACAGMVLYTTELCAPAVLLALLVFVRDGQAAAPASTHNRAQYTKA
jgi:apolipoprotein N-acyltransferase